MAAFLSLPNIPFIMSYGNSAALLIPNPSRFKPTPSRTMSSNFPGFSIQSITSPILSSIHFLPFTATSSDLLTTALPPSTTLPVAAFVPAFVPSQTSPKKLSPFFFFLGFLLDKVPLLNLGKLLNIECVCAPFITDDPLGKNAVVFLLGVSAILPLGYLIASCLKPPGPFPRPLSPTVAKVSRAILPFLTTFVVVLVCSVPVWSLIGSIFGILSFLPTQFTPSISLFNPPLTLSIMPEKKPLISPVTDLITSPILFITPVILSFIPVTKSTVPLLIPFHFLDIKPPIAFIVLIVPFLSDPLAPFTPDQVALALFTVPDLMLFHLLLMKLPTALKVLVVPFLRPFHVFFTPDHKALALFTTPFLTEVHNFRAKSFTALNIAVTPFLSALNVARTPFQSPLARFITPFLIAFQTLIAKFLTALNIADIPFFNALNVLVTPLLKALTIFITPFFIIFYTLMSNSFILLNNFISLFFT